MAEAVAAQEETEMTDHDLLIQVAVMALEDMTGAEIIACIQDLGRGDLVEQARETKALMDMTDGTSEEPAPTEPPPPPEQTEKPADAP